MIRAVLRFGFSVVVLAFTCVPASAQISWNVTYQDVIAGTQFGFDDRTIVSGSLTVGQLRQNSITAATNYLSTILDGRGSVNLRFDFSDNNPGSGTLASFGPDQIVSFGSFTPGNFQNGGVYQAARTGQRVFTGSPDGSGVFNFGRGWNYEGGSVNSNNYDMVTVAIHELIHGAGFLSFTYPDGTGIENLPRGTPNTYSVFDRYLQRGNGIGGNLLNTDINDPNFAAFTGEVSTLTNGNDPTTGLFFGGQYTREVFGGAVPIYAPAIYKRGRVPAMWSIRCSDEFDNRPECGEAFAALRDRDDAGYRLERLQLEQHRWQLAGW
jgi:hypothetical protein